MPDVVDAFKLDVELIKSYKIKSKKKNDVDHPKKKLDLVKRM